MRLLLLLQGCAALILLAVLVVVWHRHSESLDPYLAARPVSDSALAQRINHACKPGFQVYDWTVGDEYNPVPKGVVQVTCVRYHADGNYDQYKVAVKR